jgi:hypothetical protein
MLAVRLLVGQNTRGGWGYDLCAAILPDDVKRLQAMKPNRTPGKLHPDVKDYVDALYASKARDPNTTYGDDNSNTQFAVIAIWMARKHGVPVDSALDMIEKRYLATQNPNTGGWGYSASPAGDFGSTPAMYCAGLIGLSTAMARREERRLKADAPKKETPAKANAKKGPDDPFFNPPKPETSDPKKAKTPAVHKADGRDRAVQLGFAGLGSILAESAKAGNGALVLANQGHGRHDLYFFWSLERVGVIYGMDKIGGIDWWEAGVPTLLRTQSPDGSWSVGGGGLAGGYNPEIETSFAILFLLRSNLVRDLSNGVRKEVSTEMRAGAGNTGASTKSSGGASGKNSDPVPPVPELALPGVGVSEAAVMATELVRSTEKDWPTLLKKLRDSKGNVYTQALVGSMNRLEGKRRKEVRAALAERLTRMTAETLRVMAKDEDVELRRAAVLAMAMKDDKAHVPDLIAALVDEEESVSRAAKAGLKSLTGQDFGPAVNATAGEKKLAATAWKEWLSKQKK